MPHTAPSTALRRCALAIACFAAASAHAQTAPTAGAAATPASTPAGGGRVTASAQAGKGERQAVQWFNMLDANGDGLISRAEAGAAFLLRPSLKAEFEQADTNRDGHLSEQEVRTLSERRRAERRARREAEALQQRQKQSQQGQ